MIQASLIIPKCTAVMAACACAAHPLLPDAFVLHAHDHGHVHAHAIDLHAPGHRGSPNGHHASETGPATITSESSREHVVVVANDHWCILRGGTRTHVVSALDADRSLASCRVDHGLVHVLRVQRSPPVPPPRAERPLDALLLTSHALLI